MHTNGKGHAWVKWHAIVLAHIVAIVLVAHLAGFGSHLGKVLGHAPATAPETP